MQGLRSYNAFKSTDCGTTSVVATIKDVEVYTSQTGDNVTISGMVDAPLNGDFLVSEVVSRTVFKFDFMQDEVDPSNAVATYGGVLQVDHNGSPCSDSPSWLHG